MTTDESRTGRTSQPANTSAQNFHPSDRIAVLVRNGGTAKRSSVSRQLNDPGTSAQEWLQHKNEKEACDIYIGMNT